MKRIGTLAAAATVALALTLTACSDGEESDASDKDTSSAGSEASNDLGVKEVQVGDPVEVELQDGNAEVTINGASYGPPEAFDLDPSAATQGGLLVLDVTWKTLEGETAPSITSLVPKDATGTAGTITMGSVSPALGSAVVPEGEEIRGNTVTDIGEGPYLVSITDESSRSVADVAVEPAAP